jgi:hypothetical protein
MTFNELMQRLKAANNTAEYITVELDAIALRATEASPHKNATSLLPKVG